MSTYNLGIDHDSAEVAALKSTLSVKDNELAMVKDQLVQSSTRIQEVDHTLKETTHKLRLEADKRTKLEEDLRLCIEERQNQKTARENVELTLNSLNDRLKTSEKIARDLQATIDLLSSRNEGEKLGTQKAHSNLERDNSRLVARVRELEFECRQVKDSTISRPLSSIAPDSSLPDPRMIWLEQEHTRLLQLSTKHDVELNSMFSKLANLQTDLVKVENEKVGNERRLQAQLNDMTEKLEEGEEELAYLRQQVGDGSAADREKQLMERIDEDQARIEQLVKLGDGSRKTEEALHRTESKLKAEALKASKAEERNINLAREKEEALDALEKARETLSEQQIRLEHLHVRESELLEQLNTHDLAKPNCDAYSLSDMSQDNDTYRDTTETPRPNNFPGNTFEDGIMSLDGDSTYRVHSTPLSRSTRTTAPGPQPEFDTDTVQRLLAAIDRIRGERDNLKQHLEFSEMEHKFAVEAFESELAATSSKDAASSQLEAEAQILRQQATASATVVVARVKRLNLALTASSIVIEHLQSRLERVPNYLDEVIQAKDDQLFEVVQRSSELEVQLAQTAANFESLSKERGELLSHLETMEHRLRQSSEATSAETESHQKSRQELEQIRFQLTESLSAVEAQRDHLISQVQQLQADLACAHISLVEDETSSTALRQSARDSLARIERPSEKQEELHRVESQLAGLARALAEAEAQRDSFNLRAQHLEANLSVVQKEVQIVNAREDANQRILLEKESSHREIREELDQSRSQLTEITSALSDMENERDSLNLQVQHLEADLASAQDELADAQARYSALQTQKLSSMSTNAATRTLRQQIEDLEARVLRRTEQIGIHQHDIRRMETNLRLQEERISEMNSELDTLSSQKEAMVEDCAEAREARDLALKKVEAIEMEMEAVEDKMSNFVNEKDNEVATLVCVVADATTRARDSVLKMKLLLRTQLENQRRMVERLRQAEEARDQAGGRVGLLETEATVVMANMQLHLATSEEESRQATLAFVVSQLRSYNLSRSLETLASSKSSMEQKMSEQEESITGTAALIASLQHEVEVANGQRDEIDRESSRATEARISELELEIHALQQATAETEARHQQTIEQLSRNSEELLQVRKDIDDQQVQGILRQDIQALSEGHTEEIRSLQAQLDQSSEELAQIRLEQSAGDEQYQELQRELDIVKQDLQCQIEEAEEHLKSKDQLNEEIKQLRKGHQEHVSRLQEELEAASRKLEEHSRGLADQDSRRDNTVKDLLQSKVEMEARLAESEASCSNLQQRLEEEMDGRDQDRETYKDELRCAVEHSHKAESELHGEIASLQVDLEKTLLALEEVTEEKNGLEAEMTNLEAEIQRSISLRQHLENQVKEDEFEISSLQEQLAHVKREYATVEKDWSAAEVQLSLYESTHKETVNALKRELEVLRERPDAEAQILELKERYDEMEELLKSKCAEVETTDDKYLEVLQERRKLNTKIDNMTRKIQILEKKLAGATSSPKPTEKPSPVSLTVSAQAVPPVSRQPPTSRPRTTSRTPSVSRPSPTSSAEASGSRPRVVNASTRAKTPEPKAGSTIVRTSSVDMPRQVEKVTPEAEPAVSIGKKRRAPDDFDACETVPPQVFTSESLPSKQVESTTPRSRRNATTIRTGFTPVRKPPPMEGMRRVTAALPPSTTITDVTNGTAQRSVSQSNEAANPSTVVAGKRSWLRSVRAGQSAQ